MWTILFLGICSAIPIMRVRHPIMHGRRANKTEFPIPRVSQNSTDLVDNSQAGILPIPISHSRTSSTRNHSSHSRMPKTSTQFRDRHDSDHGQLTSNQPSTSTHDGIRKIGGFTSGPAAPNSERIIFLGISLPRTTWVVIADVLAMVFFISSIPLVLHCSKRRGRTGLVPSQVYPVP